MRGMTANGKVQVCSPGSASSELMDAKKRGMIASTVIQLIPQVYQSDQRCLEASLSSHGSSLHFHHWDKPGTVTMTTSLVYYFFKEREWTEGNQIKQAKERRVWR